ncbi:t-SNARE [Syncephalastrum racemosum]|uniref:t-SNARE n=1 Tax=Syncephalastrum racemosum TaxID=13706 RepID=A0A1X2HVY0_SYNRA|nr:t-SNARE [Syncephalastrum racemosum]
MSVDRLAELSRPAPAAAPGTGGRYEMRPLLSGGSNDPNSMDGFLNEISHIQETIRTINDNVTRIQGFQSSALQAADAREEQRQRANAEQISQENQELMTHVKAKLKEIEPTSRNTDLAIRKNQFSNVTRSFMDAIQRHRAIAVEGQRAESRQLERQIRIANPHATPEEIDQAVSQAEQGRPAVFAQQLMQSMTNEQRRYDAQQTYDAVQERHEDIRRLAKSIEELSSLFEEMQFLLENQGKVLTTIEDQSYDVVNSLEKGNAHVGNAIKSAKATRRKKWICFGIFAVIIIIIVIVLVVELVPKNSGNDNQGQQQQ